MKYIMKIAFHLFLLSVIV